MTHTKTFSMCFLLFLLISSTVTAAGKLEVHDAWAREAPPATTVMAAYLTLYNHAPRAYTLISLSSPDFKRVEMHRTEQRDGMSRMMPVSQVTLSRNSSVSFQPGGMHLMLINPKRRLRAGEKITLTLFFTDESSMKISLPVKKADAEPGHPMHNGQHDSHSR